MRGEPKAGSRSKPAKSLPPVEEGRRTKASSRPAPKAAAASAAASKHPAGRARYDEQDDDESGEAPASPAEFPSLATVAAAAVDAAAAAADDVAERTAARRQGRPHGQAANAARDVLRSADDAVRDPAPGPLTDARPSESVPPRDDAEPPSLRLSALTEDAFTALMNKAATLAPAAQCGPAEDLFVMNRTWVETQEEDVRRQKAELARQKAETRRQEEAVRESERRIRQSRRRLAELAASTEQRAAPMERVAVGIRSVLDKLRVDFSAVVDAARRDAAQLCRLEQAGVDEHELRLLREKLDAAERGLLGAESRQHDLVDRVATLTEEADAVRVELRSRSRDSEAVVSQLKTKLEAAERAAAAAQRQLDAARAPPEFVVAAALSSVGRLLTLSPAEFVGAALGTTESGTFGMVTKHVVKREQLGLLPGQTIAVKTIELRLRDEDLRDYPESSRLETFLQEARVHHVLNGAGHRHAVAFYGSSVRAGHGFIFMDAMLCDLGSVFVTANVLGLPLTDEEVSALLVMFVSVHLENCRVDVINIDLKPENLLLADDGHMFITDHSITHVGAKLLISSDFDAVSKRRRVGSRPDLWKRFGRSGTVCPATFPAPEFQDQQWVSVQSELFVYGKMLARSLQVGCHASGNNIEESAARRSLRTLAGRLELPADRRASLPDMQALLVELGWPVVDRNEFEACLSRAADVLKALLRRQFAAQQQARLDPAATAPLPARSSTPAVSRSPSVPSAASASSSASAGRRTTRSMAPPGSASSSPAAPSVESVKAEMRSWKTSAGAPQYNVQEACKILDSIRAACSELDLANLRDVLHCMPSYRQEDLQEMVVKVFSTLTSDKSAVSRDGKIVVKFFETLLHSPFLTDSLPTVLRTAAPTLAQISPIVTGSYRVCIEIPEAARALPLPEVRKAAEACGQEQLIKAVSHMERMAAARRPARPSSSAAAASTRSAQSTSGPISTPLFAATAAAAPPSPAPATSLTPVMYGMSVGTATPTSSRHVRSATPRGEKNGRVTKGKALPLRLLDAYRPRDPVTAAEEVGAILQKSWMLPFAEGGLAPDDFRRRCSDFDERPELVLEAANDIAGAMMQACLVDGLDTPSARVLREMEIREGPAEQITWRRRLVVYCQVFLVRYGFCNPAATPMPKQSYQMLGGTGDDGVVVWTTD